MRLLRVLERLFGRATEGSTGSLPVTREHVIWAYRLLLDRDPESDMVVNLYRDAYGTARELRVALLASPEFRLKNTDLAQSVTPNVVIKEFANGVRLFADLSDVVALRIIRGEYEPHETRFVQQTVSAGQTVVDIGAHIGWFTTLMAVSVGPTGRVYAFEPLEPIAALLARSIAENGLGDRVALERSALADRRGRGSLISPVYTLFSGGSHLAGKGYDLPPGHDARAVDLVTLDEYPLTRPVSFIKIDVEGAEPLVFRGGDGVLRRDRPVILSEILPSQLEKVAGCTPAGYIAEMGQRGYECRALEEGRPGRRLTDCDSLRSVVFLPVG
jgi:FkbM family methyltransferase